MNAWISDRLSSLKSKHPPSICTYTSRQKKKNHKPAAGLFDFHTVKMNEGFNLRPEEELEAVFKVISGAYCIKYNYSY